MDGRDIPNAVICKYCGEVFTIAEDDDAESNVPRVLLCGHIFCTSCLQSIQLDGVIRCPECEVESTLPEDGVHFLPEDSRIIGLIYTAKTNMMKNLQSQRSNIRRRNRLLSSTDLNGNTVDKEQLTGREEAAVPADTEKIKRTVDEALVQAAENLAQLEHIHEILTTGLEEQVKREKVRLVMEIKQAADKASRAIQKWKDVQLNQLTRVEAQFSASHAAACRVQERIRALEIAMQMARGVQLVPLLEQYCTLDKVLETLKAPVNNQSFNMKSITMDSGMSCVYRSEVLNRSLSLSLKMDVSNPKHLSASPPKDYQAPGSNRKPPFQWVEGRKRECVSPQQGRPPSPQQKDQQSWAAADRPALRGCSSPSPRSRRRSNRSRHSSSSDIGTPDVIIEGVLDEGEKHAPPPTGPELANDRCRNPRKKKNLCFGNRRNANLSQWVVVMHIVNPSHFYVRYVGEKRESEILSKKINHFCGRESCHFTSSDTVETGSMIFANWKEELWCRASVVELSQSGCTETVKACRVTQLASVRVFFFDSGLTKSITVQSEDGTPEVSLKAVNKHLRKVGEAVNVDLDHFAPQAIRCSLKDLVPYDLTKGWSEEAQAEFRNVVSSAAVEMRPFGQDRDSLLVDLRKAPMDQSSDVSISVREYLVFIEVARFYSPVTLSNRPLLYYPAVIPKINTELNAVVSHINNPANFYIQLVDDMESLLLSVKLQECYNVTPVDGRDDLNIYCPTIGQACVARFDDKLWYRAQVIGHPGGRKVEVFFVDFGNVKILSVSDLRKIKDEFFVLPSMAIHCCLSDVVPLDGATWTDACTVRFISLAHEKLVTIVAKGRNVKFGPLPVKLLESSLNGPRTNVAELLVKEELACFKDRFKSEPASHPDDNDSVVWEPGSATEEGINSPDQKTKIPQDQDENNEEPLEFQPWLEAPVQLKDLKVIVSHVNSPSSFYVQLAQHVSQLKRVCDLVKQECVLTEPQDVVWEADAYCGAHVNGVWERGRVCSVATSTDIAEVIRCDHGNKVKLHISNLRPLPSSLKGSLALECTLTDIRPAGGGSTWTATASNLFSHYMTGASAVMTIKEWSDQCPVPVALFCTDATGQSISMADFMVSEGVALRERKPRDDVTQKPKGADAPSPVSETRSPLSSDDQKTNGPHPPATSSVTSPSQSTSVVSPRVPPKPAPRCILSAERVKTELYDPPELPCLSHIQIRVSAVGEDGLIYTRTQNAECQLEQLRERIQRSIKTLPRQKPYTWKSVQGCAVCGPDMLWCRGQLLELLGGHVKVQYVDYGLVETIPVVHVYPMLLCEEVPQLCLPCQLHGVNPIGGRWQQDAVALLRELLLNRCVDMHVVKLPSDAREPLTVEIFLDGLSLSRIMCHHEHASMDLTGSTQGHTVMSPAPMLDDWDIDTEGLKGPEEPMLGPFILPNFPQKKEPFPVRVKHLQTPNELFLWPVEGTADVEVDGETLDEALTRINANINSLPRLTSFPREGPCLAEYSDGKFYRAKLLNLSSAEPVRILVQHVDFGSDDILPICKLRQMPAELLRFPSQVLKVKVAGFRAPSVNWEGQVLPYSPKWSVKAARDMIDLLHGNITASVVAEEPELTVLLYNKDGQLVHLPLVSSGLAELE
ncbi:RING finger protein 17 isoform X2 [Scophthalmus maximus]|uniref:RING finger protein 17 isoform X2 n=1 Tax=Scophthalmus maximus TaxID=52904 RepID=UPI001FA8D299|nr:RING finger protein 17 isoform X2 [Scophthalmus maximus]